MQGDAAPAQTLCETCVMHCQLYTQLTHAYEGNSGSGSGSEGEGEGGREREAEELASKRFQLYSSRIASLFPFPCFECSEAVASELLRRNRRFGFGLKSDVRTHAPRLVRTTTLAIAASLVQILAGLLVSAGAALAPRSTLAAIHQILHSHHTRYLIHYSVTFLILLAPLAFVNPLAPLLDSSAALFHNYRAVAVPDLDPHDDKDSHTLVGKIVWARDNTVAFLSLRQLRWWPWRARRRVQQSKPVGILRVRLKKRLYLGSQMLLMILRLATVYWIQRENGNIRQVALINIAIFVLSVLVCVVFHDNVDFKARRTQGCIALRCSFVFSILGSTISKPQIAESDPNLARRQTSLVGRKYSLFGTSLTRRDSAIFEDSSATSTLLRNRRQGFKEPAEHDSLVDSLEFALANSIISPPQTGSSPLRHTRRSFLTSSPPRGHVDASPAANAATMGIATLCDVDVAAAALRTRYARIAACRVGTLCTFGGVVMVWAVLFCREVGVLKEGAAMPWVWDVVNFAGPFLRGAFLVMMASWRVLWSRWLDEDVGMRRGRILSWGLFGFFALLNCWCVANDVLDGALVPTALESWMGRWTEGSKLPTWMGGELVQVFDLDVGVLRRVVYHVMDMTVLIAARIAGGCV
ncbi:hypothetical protein BC830DRAFT_1168865 [Chytriomyces sp. MP71]|nr:hypothetical protein BC830DRAFT_1168865 [Chytriomyces sp. MP71]